jgi:hypothetical protein
MNAGCEPAFVRIPLLCIQLQIVVTSANPAFKREYAGQMGIADA